MPLRRSTFSPLVVLLLIFARLPAAKADLGVVLADPTTIGASAWTHAGHSLVYLSGVCAASPVRARLCQPGEQGSVLTTYPDFGETHPYSWNLVPFSLYLYGSSRPQDRLLYGSKPVKEALEVHARSDFLSEVCADGHCPEAQHSYWRDLVAATTDRDVFIYAVHTTRQQDQAAVDWLNDRANVNHYNGIANNCAVFTSELVNAIFPHSVHRDLLNDLGMMGPKAAARSFKRWALDRPDLGFYSMHFAQQPGAMPRCGLARSGTEAAIHTKKYLIPAALIGEHEVAGSFFVAYYLTGRFGLYKEFARYPSSSVVTLEADAKSARAEGDAAEWSVLRVSAEAKRTSVVGSPQDWQGFRDRFDAMEDGAEAQELSPGGKRLFPVAFKDSEITVDDAGYPWLTVGGGGSVRRVGLSSENVLSPGSDPELAFQLMLGRVDYVLRAKDHMRETMDEFRKDWSLLEDARDRLSVTPNGAIIARSMLRSSE